MLKGGIGIFQVNCTADGRKNLHAGVCLAEVTGASRCFCLRPNLDVLVSRYENAGGGIVNRREPFAQFQPSHPFQLNVKYKAIKIRPFRVRKKCFSGEIRDRLKVSGPQQSTHRAAKTLIIINDSDIDILFAAHNEQTKSKKGGLSTAL